MTIKQLLTDSRDMLGDRKGATAIEYGLIAAGVALVLVAAIALFTPGLTATFQAVADKLVAPAAP